MKRNTSSIEAVYIAHYYFGEIYSDMQFSSSTLTNILLNSVFHWVKLVFLSHKNNAAPKKATAYLKSHFRMLVCHMLLRAKTSSPKT